MWLWETFTTRAFILTPGCESWDLTAWTPTDEFKQKWRYLFWGGSNNIRRSWGVYAEMYQLNDESTPHLLHRSMDVWRSKWAEHRSSCTMIFKVRSAALIACSCCRLLYVLWLGWEMVWIFCCRETTAQRSVIVQIQFVWVGLFLGERLLGTKLGYERSPNTARFPWIGV
jgi:hypothetical protein